MRQTTWAEWDPAAMRDAADLEGRISLSAMNVPEQRTVESLPYSPAFGDYRMHVVSCADCRRDDRADCPEGEGLLVVARVGIGEQARMAAQN